MIKLRKILLYDNLYTILFIIFTIVSLLNTKLVNHKSKYQIDNTIFNLKLTNYSSDGDKLQLELQGKEKIVGIYYFKTEQEKKKFLDTYNVGDKLLVKGKLEEPKNNTIPNISLYKNVIIYIVDFSYIFIFPLA